jgi:hypothetical protein
MAGQRTCDLRVMSPRQRPNGLRGARFKRFPEIEIGLWDLWDMLPPAGLLAILID